MTNSRPCPPFLVHQAGNPPVAQWFCVPEGSVKLERLGAIPFHSCLYLYGTSQDFTSNARLVAFDATDRVVWEGELPVPPLRLDAGKACSSFRSIMEVPFLKEPPTRIVVSSGPRPSKGEHSVGCAYHRLSGTITDFEGRPFRGFVLVFPDSFETSIGVRSDDEGHFDLLLPERAYTALAVDDESYGITTTETWAWHVIHDSDQRMDFLVGNMEVYNLHAWANCGAGPSLFVSFRPMSLPLHKQLTGPVPVRVGGEKEFGLLDLSPSLAAGDVSVTVNGIPTPLLSLQSLYETPDAGTAMHSYLAQIGSGNAPRNERLTLRVELNTAMPSDDGTTAQRGMAYYQFHLNGTGQSGYF